MNLNTHPHPYGAFIGGNDMGTADQTLYCAAYGNGKFVVRGFGPGPFKMNGFLGEACRSPKFYVSLMQLLPKNIDGEDRRGEASI
jgi:hypothetical protein